MTGVVAMVQNGRSDVLAQIYSAARCTRASIRVCGNVGAGHPGPVAEPGGLPLSLIRVQRTITPIGGTMPTITGRPFKQASDLLSANGIDYKAVGSDGAAYSSTPNSAAIVEKADTKAGDPVPHGQAVTIHIKGTEAELNAAATASARQQQGRFGTNSNAVRPDR